MRDYAAVTSRLILRPWVDRDVSYLHRICADPRVMKFLGPVQSQAQVEQIVMVHNELHRRLGYCFWAIEQRNTRTMIGLCGVQPAPDNTPLAGKTEIGWRLAFDHQGYGYAYEAAAAALQWCWEHLPDDAIWAMTVVGNVRSSRLMERLGMRRRIEYDFDHPLFDPGHDLCRHIVYSIERPA
jgi:RimJ/RimL family protein N-acetyltransferase